MPRPHPPELRQRAVELARMREKPVAQIAEDLGTSDSRLRNSLRQADIDEGRREGLSSSERAELVELRRELVGREDGERDPEARCGLVRTGERPPKMTFAFIAE